MFFLHHIQETDRHFPSPERPRLIFGLLRPIGDLSGHMAPSQAGGHPPTLRQPGYPAPTLTVRAREFHEEGPPAWGRGCAQALPGWAAQLLTCILNRKPGWPTLPAGEWAHGMAEISNAPHWQGPDLSQGAYGAAQGQLNFFSGHQGPCLTPTRPLLPCPAGPFASPEFLQLRWA